MTVDKEEGGIKCLPYSKIQVDMKIWEYKHINPWGTLPYPCSFWGLPVNLAQWENKTGGQVGGDVPYKKGHHSTSSIRRGLSQYFHFKLIIWYVEKSLLVLIKYILEWDLIEIFFWWYAFRTCNQKRAQVLSYIFLIYINFEALFLLHFFLSEHCRLVFQ